MPVEIHVKEEEEEEEEEDFFVFNDTTRWGARIVNILTFEILFFKVVHVHYDVQPAYQAPILKKNKKSEPQYITLQSHFQYPSTQHAFANSLQYPLSGTNSQKREPWCIHSTKSLCIWLLRFCIFFTKK